MTVVRRETVHRMGRRCHGWDYRGRGEYLITVNAAKRGRGVFGEVSASALAPKFIPNRLGAIVEREWLRLADAWPGVRLLAHQTMEDHFHGVLATPSFMAKPLGAIVGSFKARASSEAGESLWEKGYVDSILFDAEARERAITYVRDNPRRLAMKRANPRLFKVVRELKVAGVGSFSAIGNHFLIEAPVVFQMQCSRRDFAYARDAGRRILRDAPPRVKTAAFDEKAAEMIEEIEHGAVVLSPCVSEGERELARIAFERKARVVVLKNKGFAPLGKPSGALFEACAEGRLLMLAPAAWPYIPGEKPITRFDAVAMNRIAQWLAGSGAAEINYHGMQPSNIDALALAAVKGGA